MSEEAPEHACRPGTFKTEHDGPFYRGVFADGEEYKGQHLYYEERCASCGFVVGRWGHDGPCYSADEIFHFDSFWSALHQTFVYPADGTPFGWPRSLAPERQEEIEAYFRGWGERPGAWFHAAAKPRSSGTAGKVRRKR